MSLNNNVSAFGALEKSLRAAAQTYSNVHRGAGLYSSLSTRLYEHSREVFLSHWALDARDWTVVFGSEMAVKPLIAGLRDTDYRLCRSADLGLPLGLNALAVKKRSLPHAAPPLSGGGTIKLVSPDRVVWADAPDRFEAGTPSILNAVLLARALEITRHLGPDVFIREKLLQASNIEELFAPYRPELNGAALLQALELSLPARQMQIPVTQGRNTYVYLDHAASKPALLPVLDVFGAALRLPEAMYEQAVQHTAAICASYFNAPPEDYELIFTANTSEAINLVAALLPLSLPPARPAYIINSLLEHHSNELPWRYAPGWRQIRLDVDAQGWINLTQLEEELKQINRACEDKNRPFILVSVCGASNVLGTLNDLEAISYLTHRYGALLLVDAAQLAAHRVVDMQGLGIDFLAFSGHKVYAPFGCGALLARRGLLNGDLLEQASTGGKQNVAGITALGVALNLLQRIGLDVVEMRERDLCVYLLQSLSQIPALQLYGLQDVSAGDFKRRSAVLSFRFKQVPHNLAAAELSAEGIGVRQGCFCAHLLVKRLMHIQTWRARLADMGSFILPGITAGLLPGLVRVSLGLGNTREDINRLASALQKTANRSRNHWQRWLASNHNGLPWGVKMNDTPAEKQFISQYCQTVFPEWINLD